MSHDKARAFLERYVAQTGLLSLAAVADLEELAAVFERHDTVDETVRRLLSVKSLRSGPVPRLVTHLRQAVTGDPEGVLCDARGSVERLLSPGGVPFFLVQSRPRQVQIGVPSESIKVFVRQGVPVPTVYFLPPDNSSSYGDIEFPLFWNFFIMEAASDRRKRVVLVGRAAQLERVKAVFQESMFGPRPQDLCVTDDIDIDARESGYRVDFYAEQKALAQQMATVDDFAVFVPLDEDGVAVLEDGLELRLLSSCLLEVYQNCPAMPGGGERELVASLDLTALSDLDDPEGQSTPSTVFSVFCPPSFGVTFIGTSHGFDGHGHTTGFILWIASRGILVDPPVGTNDFLLQNRIPATLLRDVILTHVHADHDAGLLPLLLRHPHRIAVHTFRSVHEAFQRKLRHKVAEPELLYDWHAVLARRPIKLHGALFECDFSFHALPTLCFTVRFGGRAIAYSADTFYEPQRLRELGAAGVFCPQRLESLLQWPLRTDVDLLIHESGVPPIHTPLWALEALPASVKRRLRVVHCSSIPAGRVCVIPGCGMGHTLALPLLSLHEGLALNARLAGLLLSSQLFEGLSGQAAHELMLQMQIVSFLRGDVLMRRGDVDQDRVLLVVDGMAVVTNSALSGVSVATGLEAGHEGFPQWPPVPRQCEGAEFGTLEPLCSASLEMLHSDTEVVSVLTSGAVAGLSRLLPLPPPRNASIVVSSDVCICLQWTGFEVKNALANR